MGRVRPPAVAGTFYPAEPQRLGGAVEALLQEADEPESTQTAPKALIAPHAGYIYSGPVAASAFRQLLPRAQEIERVVLLGPAHRVPLRGLALPDADALGTPLGEVAVDRQLAARLLELPQVSVNAAAHAVEHSLEVEIPFLQRILDEFCLLPLVVGAATAEEVAEVLEACWGGAETVVVISSDLSHYHPYEVATALDQRTSRAIVALEPLRGHEQACGATPINGLLVAARNHGLEARLVDLRNSGDTCGDRGRVVGYGAFLFSAS